jgi:TM2 domain-containing membrane protein YozV
MEKFRCMVHPAKFSISLGTFLLLLILGISQTAIGHTAAGLVLIILCIPFFLIQMLYGSVVRFSDEKIIQSYLGITIRQVNWSDILEVGVIGTRIFNKKHPEKTGSVYIYFSRETLTDEQRFKMSLEWPPLQKIFICYTEKHFEQIQMIWSKNVPSFNIGRLSL